MDWYRAPDIQKTIKHLVDSLHLGHINPERVICFRSYGSSSQAQARIWSFPRIWQQALNLPAHYIIEILSERFDQLPKDDQCRVLIHELLHIPKNFSGSLVAHRGRTQRIDKKKVETLFKNLKC